MTMTLDNSKNYVGSTYVSTPITAAPPAGDLEYGQPYNDWREPAYDGMAVPVPVCPIKF